MGVNINFGNIKKRCFVLSAIAFYCGLTWLAYGVSIHGIIDLIESRSIIYYFWACFIGILFVPAFSYFVFVFIFVFFTKSLQAPKFLARGVTLTYHYFGVAFIIGALISFIVIFYPLGTNYVFCERSGPFSGTYYTRTEEICEQVKYLKKNKSYKAIQQLKDQLDSVATPSNDGA